MYFRRASVHVINEYHGAKSWEENYNLLSAWQIKNSSLCSQQMDPLNLHCSSLASCPLSCRAPCSRHFRSSTAPVQPGQSLMSQCYMYSIVIGRLCMWECHSSPVVALRRGRLCCTRVVHIASSHPYRMKVHYKAEKPPPASIDGDVMSLWVQSQVLTACKCAMTFYCT